MLWRAGSKRGGARDAPKPADGPAVARGGRGGCREVGGQAVVGAEVAGGGVVVLLLLQQLLLEERGVEEQGGSGVGAGAGVGDLRGEGARFRV